MSKKIKLEEGEITTNSLGGLKIELSSGPWYIGREDLGYRGLLKMKGRRVAIMAQLIPKR
jgi:hypothetical protein